MNAARAAGRMLALLLAAGLGLGGLPSAYADATGGPGLGGLPSAHADETGGLGLGGLPSAYADASGGPDLGGLPSAYADASGGLGLVATEAPGLDCCETPDNQALNVDKNGRGATAIGLPEATAISPADSPEADTVYSSAELATWLDEHSETGGTVCFGADITADRLFVSLSRDALDSGAAIRIDTGEYSLTVTGYLRIREAATFIGAGYPNPVVSIAAGGELYSYGSSEPYPLSWFVSTADGGCALMLEDGSSLAVNSGNMGFGAAALGADGVALHSAIELTDPEYELWGMVIEATGPGGRGLVCTRPVSLLLSRITADAAAVQAPTVILDTCAVEPAVPAATVIERKLLLSAADQQNAGLLPLGENPYTAWRAIATLEADGHAPIAAIINTRFDSSQVNPDAVGVYPMPLHIPAPYSLASHDLDAFTVEVFDPALPRFFKVTRFFMPRPGYSLDYYYSGSAQDLLLWKSDDWGESWYIWWSGQDADENGMVEDCPVSISSSGYGQLYMHFTGPALDLRGESLLVFEVPSLQSGSAALLINFDDISVMDGISGDRIAADRFPFPWLNIGGEDPGGGGGAGGAGTGWGAGSNIAGSGGSGPGGGGSGLGAGGTGGSTPGSSASDNDAEIASILPGTGGGLDDSQASAGAVGGGISSPGQSDSVTTVDEQAAQPTSTWLVAIALGVSAALALLAFSVWIRRYRLRRD